MQQGFPCTHVETTATILLCLRTHLWFDEPHSCGALQDAVHLYHTTETRASSSLPPPSPVVQESCNVPLHRRVHRERSDRQPLALLLPLLLPFLHSSPSIRTGLPPPSSLPLLLLLPLPRPPSPSSPHPLSLPCGYPHIHVGVYIVQVGPHFFVPGSVKVGTEHKVMAFLEQRSSIGMGDNGRSFPVSFCVAVTAIPTRGSFHIEQVSHHLFIPVSVKVGAPHKKATASVE